MILHCIWRLIAHLISLYLDVIDDMQRTLQQVRGLYNISSNTWYAEDFTTGQRTLQHIMMILHCIWHLIAHLILSLHDVMTYDMLILHRDTETQRHRDTETHTWWLSRHLAMPVHELQTDTHTEKQIHRYTGAQTETHRHMTERHRHTPGIHQAFCHASLGFKF